MNEGARCILSSITVVVTPLERVAGDVLQLHAGALPDELGPAGGAARE
jgi:hypothetical protein